MSKQKLNDDLKEKLIARFEYNFVNCKSVFNEINGELRKKVILRVRTCLKQTLEERY